MQLPREVMVGNETLHYLSVICKRLGFYKSALVVTGQDTERIAGSKVIDLLCDKGMDVDSILVNNSTLEEVSDVEERIKTVKPEIVLGVGGGSKIEKIIHFASNSLPGVMQAIFPCKTNFSIATPYHNKNPKSHSGSYHNSNFIYNTHWLLNA